MIELRTVNVSLVRRLRSSLFVALASLSTIAIPQNDAHAGWWPMSPKQKPAEGAEPKTPGGASEMIQKLTKEAKAQEAEGNFEQAISLASRALRISERVSNTTKSDPEISPASIARYENDLRLKKAEKSVKRVERPGKPPHADPATPVVRAPARPKATAAEINPPVPRKVVAVKPPETKTDRKVATQDRQIVAQQPPKVQSRPMPSTVVAARKPLTAGADTAAKPVAQSTTPKTSAPLPDDFFDKEFRSGSDTVNQKPKSRSIARTDNEVKVTSFDDDKTAQVRPKSRQQTPDRVPNSDRVDMPAPLKLRTQYTSSELAEFLQTTASAKPAANSGRPTIHPRAGLQQADNTLPEPRRILPVAAEEDPNPEAKSEAKTEVESVANFDDDFDPKPGEQADQKPENHFSQDDFPVEKVRQLKRRLETAAALEPGAVAPAVASNFDEDSEDDFASKPSSKSDSVFRLRKPRNPFPEFSKEISEPIATNTSRHPDVGHSSMVKWRPAKEEPEARDRKADLKDSHLPEDLRQSLRGPAGSTSNDMSPSLMSQSSVDFKGSTNNAKSRRSDPPVGSFSDNRSSAGTLGPGSLWDNATAPSLDRDFGASSVTSNTITFHLTPPASAPLPPTEFTTDQEHLDSAKSVFNRHRRPESNPESLTTSDDSGMSGSMSIAPLSYSEDAAESVLTTEQDATCDGQNRAAQTTVTKRPAKGLAFLFGTVFSTFVSMLSAAGLAAFIAGLWMVRVMVGSKTSE